jgi:hypothetical protein
VHFTLESMSIFNMKSNSKVVVGEVNHQSQLYTFSNFLEPDSYLLLMHVDDNSILWKKRFGHLKFRYMQQLRKKTMVTGAPNIHFFEGVCQGCILGNNPQEKFKKGKAHRSSSPLDMIQCDIMGPFPHPSIGKSRCVLTCLDDYSCYTWVFFVRYNSNIFEHLKKFKALVETQSRINIEALCIDNGGEYVNIDVQKLCIEFEIQFQHTIPYTPQQNGVSEQKNKYLNEMASCMLYVLALGITFKLHGRQAQYPSSYM